MWLVHRHGGFPKQDPAAYGIFSKHPWEREIWQTEVSSSAAPAPPQHVVFRWKHPPG